MIKRSIKYSKATLKTELEVVIEEEQYSHNNTKTFDTNSDYRKQTERSIQNFIENSNKNTFKRIKSKKINTLSILIFLGYEKLDGKGNATDRNSRRERKSENSMLNNGLKDFGFKSVQNSPRNQNLQKFSLNERNSERLHLDSKGKSTV